MELRPLEKGDLAALAALERISFSSPLSESSLLSALSSPFTYGFGLFEGEALWGYAFLFALCEEGDLMNIAVSPDHRGRGLSKILMDAVLQKARALQVETLHLEVRWSNTPARALYTRYGFAQTGVRRGYYTSPREDALLMTLTLEKEDGADEKA